MGLYKIGTSAPTMHERAWIANSAEVIGEVRIADGVSVWSTAVIRGDNEPIEIGSRSNVQEGAILHSDPGFPLTIGEDVTVGHRAVLHGCSIGNGSLIGIGAIVLNGARIGQGCLVGAGALVTEGKDFPDFSLIVGSPARLAKQLTSEQVKSLKESALHYVENGRRFDSELKPVQGGI